MSPKPYLSDLLPTVPSNPCLSQRFLILFSSFFGLNNDDDLYHIPEPILEQFRRPPPTPAWGDERPLTNDEKHLWGPWHKPFAVIAHCVMWSLMEPNYQPYAVYTNLLHGKRGPMGEKPVSPRSDGMTIEQWEEWTKANLHHVRISDEMLEVWLEIMFGTEEIRVDGDEDGAIKSVYTRLARVFGDRFIEQYVYDKWDRRMKAVLEEYRALEDLCKDLRATKVTKTYIKDVRQYALHTERFALYEQWLDPTRSSRILLKLRATVARAKRRICEKRKNLVEEFTERPAGTRHAVEYSFSPLAEDRQESVGVELLSPLSVAQLKSILGFTGKIGDKDILNAVFNSKVLAPRQHQWAAVTEMVTRVYNGYRAIIVADQAGLGKTAQALLFVDTILGLGCKYWAFDQDWAWEKDGEFDEEYLDQAEARLPLSICLRKSFDTFLGSRPNSGRVDGYLKNPPKRRPGGFAGTEELAPTQLPTLVIAPAHLCRNWQVEDSRWNRLTRVFMLLTEKDETEAVDLYHGIMEDYQHLIEDREQRGDSSPLEPDQSPISTIFIVSLQTSVRLHSAFEREPYDNSISGCKWGVTIVDEAHAAKNVSKTAQTIKTFSRNSSFTTGLTGSFRNNSQGWRIADALGVPAANGAISASKLDHPEEMVDLEEAREAQDIVVRNGTRNASLRWYSGRSGRPGQPIIEREPPSAALIDATLASEKRLQPNVIRRRRDQKAVNGEPLVILGALKTVVLPIKLTPREDDIVHVKMGDPERSRKDLGKYGQCYGKGLQATVAPERSWSGKLPRPYSTELYADCPTKVGAIFDLIEIIEQREMHLPQEEKSKILIWIKTVSLLDVFHLEASRRGKGLRTLTGQTPMKARQQLMDEVNNPRDHPVDSVERARPNELFSGPQTTRILVAGMDAAGEGVNLPGCNRVIMPNMPWDDEEYDQLVSRSHRQRPDRSLPARDTWVYLLVARNSVDCAMLRLVASKKIEQTDFALDCDPINAAIQTVLNAQTDKRISLTDISPRKFAKMVSSPHQIFNPHQIRVLKREKSYALSMAKNAYLPRTQLTGPTGLCQDQLSPAELLEHLGPRSRDARLPCLDDISTERPAALQQLREELRGQGQVREGVVLGRSVKDEYMKRKRVVVTEAMLERAEDLQDVDWLTQLCRSMEESSGYQNLLDQMTELYQRLLATYLDAAEQAPTVSKQRPDVLLDYLKAHPVFESVRMDLDMLAFDLDVVERQGGVSEKQDIPYSMEEVVAWFQHSKATNDIFAWKREGPRPPRSVLASIARGIPAELLDDSYDGPPPDMTDEVAAELPKFYRGYAAAHPALAQLCKRQPLEESDTESSSSSSYSSSGSSSLPGPGSVPPRPLPKNLQPRALRPISTRTEMSNMDDAVPDGDDIELFSEDDDSWFVIEPPSKELHSGPRDDIELFSDDEPVPVRRPTKAPSRISARQQKIPMAQLPLAGTRKSPRKSGTKTVRLRLEGRNEDVLPGATPSQYVNEDEPMPTVPNSPSSSIMSIDPPEAGPSRSILGWSNPRLHRPADPTRDFRLSTPHPGGRRGSGRQ